MIAFEDGIGDRLVALVMDLQGTLDFGQHR